MYIFLFNLKNTNENRKINFLTIICEMRKKRKNVKLFALISKWNVFFHLKSKKINNLYVNDIEHRVQSATTESGTLVALKFASETSCAR